MSEEKKLLGEHRRQQLLQWLKEASTPIRGSELAKRTNVSRQVIVQDISLLKARQEPLIATSQGYLYFHSSDQARVVERIVACYHAPERTSEELRLIVAQGVTVKDVIIEHPVYGDLTASIMVSTQDEADQLIEKLATTKSQLLSQLTDGTHLHTLQAPSHAQLDAACEALRKAGILLETN